ncbi:hypothetical protein LR004_00775 [Candidatus Gracilibacteria bacterium]|nr:hypothetical protein [Candidatus Gracilibacteria bacterium]
MKKILTKILLISIILLGFGNINQSNAGDLDGFEEIFNQQEEFSCTYINKRIGDYSKYKGMIDNYFRKISTKSYTYKKNIYTKLGNLADRKLTTINKNRQAKIYTVIGYIKCESNKKFDKLTNDNNFYTLDNFLKNSEVDIFSRDFNGNINSCDYENTYGCERNSSLEYFTEIFYLNIKNLKIDKAVEIAKENPGILELGLRGIDIRNINGEIYILETGLEAGWISFSNITVSNNKIINKRNWIDLNRIYGEKSTEENFNKAYPMIKLDFHKIKTESPMY